MSQVVVLAVMDMEPQGGVADQMTALALELPGYGITPVVLVRNPLAANHAYANRLGQRQIDVWAISNTQYRFVRRLFRLLWYLTLPAAWLDSLLRQKTLLASRGSLWSVLRRIGYAGLDAIFWLRLVQARIARRAHIIHFRKPDGWQKIRWAERLGFRVIYTEDALPQPDTQQFYQGLSRVRTSIRCITAVSQASAAELRVYLSRADSVHVIPNMVHAEASSPPMNRQSDAQFLLGSLARLVPEKDVGTLLRAFSQVATQVSTVRLIILGDGPERSSLESLVQDLRISNQVVFAGAYSKSDLPLLMSEIDLIVLSSRYEGFGVVLAEGMAYGKPAVATASGGAAEVVVHDVTGLLVPIADPQALAEAILALVNDRPRYDRMALAARERYLNCYTPEQVVPQYVALYEGLAR